jgi:uncharacterized membrane protein
MDYALLLALRLLHVLGGVMWVGAGALLAGFVVPAAQGPDSGAFMQRLMVDRRAQVYLVATALVTVVTGIALYVRITSLTQGAFAGTGAGMAFGIGGAAGVAGLLVGALVNGPAGKQMTTIGARLAAERRPPTAEEAAEMARLQARMRGASWTALVLLLLATACMAVARYV